MTTVGVYEAKTRLAQLLHRVEAGETIAITRHGKEVARIVPPARSARPDVGALIDQWIKTRDRNRISLAGLDIKALINEGRR